MKSIIYTLLCAFLLVFAGESVAQLPPEMRAKLSDAQYAKIMSQHHFHFEYHKYPPVDKPVERGRVKLGTEYFNRYQGPNGWYYCHFKDGECFDRRALGVDPTGSFWVDDERKPLGFFDTRDVSYFKRAFRERADLGPPMTLPDPPSLSKRFIQFSVSFVSPLLTLIHIESP